VNPPSISMLAPQALMLFGLGMFVWCIWYFRKINSPLDQAAQEILRQERVSLGYMAVIFPLILIFAFGKLPQLRLLTITSLVLVTAFSQARYLKRIRARGLPALFVEQMKKFSWMMAITAVLLFSGIYLDPHFR
jgi:hypothetical protein